MKPQEFLALTERFKAALEKRCREQGVLYKYLGKWNPRSPWDHFLVGDEVYSLYNDGEKAKWEYVGKFEGFGFRHAPDEDDQEEA